MSESAGRLETHVGLQYNPEITLDRLGIAVVRIWLRDTWAAWSASNRTVVLASGLTRIQERCVLAHEVEHIAGGDFDCSNRRLSIRQERRADIGAARRLIAISDLAEIAQWADDVSTAALELNVTERMLQVRLNDLAGEGWPWPAGSKIAG
jgi:hypothetical protein